MSLTQYVLFQKNIRLGKSYVLFLVFRVLPQPKMTGYDREDDEAENEPKTREVSSTALFDSFFIFTTKSSLFVGRSYCEIRRTSLWRAAKFRSTSSRSKNSIQCSFHIFNSFIFHNRCSAMVVHFRKFTWLNIL